MYPKGFKQQPNWCSPVIITVSDAKQTRIPHSFSCCSQTLQAINWFILSLSVFKATIKRVIRCLFKTEGNICQIYTVISQNVLSDFTFTKNQRFSVCVQALYSVLCEDVSGSSWTSPKFSQDELFHIPHSTFASQQMHQGRLGLSGCHGVFVPFHLWLSWLVVCLHSPEISLSQPQVAGDHISTLAPLPILHADIITKSSWSHFLKKVHQSAPCPSSQRESPTKYLNSNSSFPSHPFYIVVYFMAVV